MKNKIQQNLIGIVAVILFTALPAYCAPVTLKETAIRFLCAMGGVVLSSVIIFAGLTIYNKYFIKPVYKDLNEDDNLTSPQTQDEAITMFIKKNKLR